jgi:hypothetical protein
MSFQRVLFHRQLLILTQQIIIVMTLSETEEQDIIISLKNYNLVDTKDILVERKAS